MKLGLSKIYLLLTLSQMATARGYTSLASCVPYGKSLYKCIANDSSENLICRKESTEIECWLSGKWEAFECTAGWFQDINKGR